MAEADRTRIEVAFEGGTAIGVLVSADVAAALEQALDSGGNGSFGLEAEDGHYTIALKRVVYVKRFARDIRVGFGTA